MRGLVHLSYFAWVVVPVALYGVYAAFGTPHGLWEYDYVHRFASDDPYHTSCTYLGATGARTVPAPDGRCWWIVFFTEGTR